MKKTLLILTLTLIISQQLQSQSLFDIGSTIIGNSKSSKKQKKIDRENFVSDSIRNVSETRVTFVSDSIKKIILNNQYIEEKRLKELQEKKKHEWKYVGTNQCIFREFTINQRTVKFLVKDVLEGNRSFCDYQNQNESASDFKVRSDIGKLNVISAEIFTDTTTTTKLGKIELAKIPTTEIFSMVASNDGGLTMFKSLKDNKAYVVHNYAFNFSEYDTHGIEPNQRLLISEYTDPLTNTKEKAAVANYRTRLNSAISTIIQLEAIQKKHWYKTKNQFGYVTGEFYDSSKFNKTEVSTYKQLFKKLEMQRENLITTNKQRVGRKVLQDDLLDTPDFGKQIKIEEAYSKYRI